MELLQLRYFVALARTGNLTRTAENLCISPSSLSLTISKLERELGVKLYNRIGRRMYINADGLKFLGFVSDALSELDMGVAKMQGKRTISLAVNTMEIWSGAISDYMVARPDVMVDCHVRKQSEMENDMLLTTYEFLLSGDDVTYTDDALDVRSVADTDLLLAVNEDNPLAKKSVVSLHELASESFVMPSRGYRLYNLHMSLCNENNFEPKVIANCGFLVRMRFVAEGRAVSFVDRQMATTDMMKRIAYVPLVEHLPARNICVIWHKKRELTAIEKDFLDYVTLYFQS